MALKSNHLAKMRLILSLYLILSFNFKLRKKRSWLKKERLRKLISSLKEKYYGMINGNKWTHAIEIGKSIKIRTRWWYRQWIGLKRNKAMILKVGIIGISIVLASSVHPLFATGGMAGAVITSTASGNWNAGATWVGGTAPGTGDDGIIANTHTVTLTVAQTTGSCVIQAGGTLAGGGFTLTCDDENGAGLAFNHDGTISGVLDLIFFNNPSTAVELLGTSGNVRNIEINTANSLFLFVTNTTIDGNLTITQIGTRVYMSVDTYTLTIGGNLYIASGMTFGGATWTGALTIGGNVIIDGTFLSADSQVQTIGGPIHIDPSASVSDSLLLPYKKKGKMVISHLLKWNILQETSTGKR